MLHQTQGPGSCCALPTTLPPTAGPEQGGLQCPQDTFTVGKHNPSKTGHWVKLCWRFSRACVKYSMPQGLLGKTAAMALISPLCAMSCSLKLLQN